MKDRDTEIVKMVVCQQKMSTENRWLFAHNSKLRSKCRIKVLPGIKEYDPLNLSPCLESLVTKRRYKSSDPDLM